VRLFVPLMLPAQEIVRVPAEILPAVMLRLPATVSSPPRARAYELE